MVQGRPLLPGVALFEAALAAGTALHSPPPAATSTTSALAALSLAIPMPLALSASHAGMTLQLEVGLRGGAVAVQGAGGRSTHLTGRLVPVGAAAAAPADADIATPVAPVSLSWLLQRESPTHALQTACISVSPAVHTCGYCCHPAVFDSVLHTGASLAVPVAAAGERQQRPVIRVPVAVGAVLSGTDFKPHHCQLAAQGQLVELPSGDSDAATSAYAMRNTSGSSGASDPSLLQIAGLEARPVNLPPEPTRRALFPAATAVSAAAACSAETAAPELLYAVQWEASSKAYLLPGAASGIVAHSGLPAIHLLSSKTGSGSSSMAIGASVAPGPAMSRLLAGLQRISFSGASGANVRLATIAGASVAAASGPGRRLLDPSAAAAWGMLRVAASEAPDASWSAVELDSAAWSAGAAAGEVSDVSGSVVRSGLLLRPMLAGADAHAAVAAAATVQGCGMNGLVVVTGGLGGIGMLLGSWLIKQQPTAPALRVALLGRSGLFGSTPAELLLSNAPVIAARCDASIAEDVAAALAGLRAAPGSASVPLRGILHASGVLADAVLVKQSAAGLRSVLAPKLSFLSAADDCGSLTLQPLTALNLFSSVSSFLGSPGQANYAAANAALNVFAESVSKGELDLGLFPCAVDYAY